MHMESLHRGYHIDNDLFGCGQNWRTARVYRLYGNSMFGNPVVAQLVVSLIGAERPNAADSPLTFWILTLRPLVQFVMEVM